MLTYVFIIQFLSLIHSQTNDLPCDRKSDVSCWVYGNHYQKTAYDICALGTPSCLWSDPEPINITSENLRTHQWLLSMDPSKIIVFITPGETDLYTDIPIRMSDDEHERVHMTAILYQQTVSKYGDIAVIIPAGGNAHPSDPRTMYNEAYQMKQILFREYGVNPERIIIDPYAQHSTTNLRNVGRYMMQMGIKNATIVTDYSQSFYYGHDWLSTFYLRCLDELGYIVGDLEAITLTTTYFSPSTDCWRKGDDPLDP